MQKGYPILSAGAAQRGLVLHLLPAGVEKSHPSTGASCASILNRRGQIVHDLFGTHVPVWSIDARILRSWHWGGRIPTADRVHGMGDMWTDSLLCSVGTIAVCWVAHIRVESASNDETNAQEWNLVCGRAFGKVRTQVQSCSKAYWLQCHAQTAPKNDVSPTSSSLVPQIVLSIQCPSFNVSNVSIGPGDGEVWSPET